MPVGDRHRRDPAAERLPARPDRLALRACARRGERRAPGLLQVRRRDPATRRPLSMYGKLNRSVATPSSFIARANPAMNGWSMPAPAPCASTSVRGGSAGRAYMPETCTRAVLDRRAVPQGSPRVPSCHDERQLLPGHLGVRLRRVEARRLLPGGPEEPRDALLLLVAALVGGDQLHVPPVPDGEVARRRGASRRSPGSCSR